MRRILLTPQEDAQLSGLIVKSSVDIMLVSGSVCLFLQWITDEAHVKQMHRPAALFIGAEGAEERDGDSDVTWLLLFCLQSDLIPWTLLLAEGYKPATPTQWDK